MHRVPLVTLTTDLGSTYAAQLKAVLYQSLPPGHVVDLSHDLPPHRLGEGAFLLRHMAAGFPPGTIHVAVVDPGVGGQRAPLAILCREGSVLLGPDNGVLSLLADHLGGPQAYLLKTDTMSASTRVGATFDGRDLFAPAAARVALGSPLTRLGTRTTFHRLRLPSPRREKSGGSGVIVHVDRFGNLISNLPSSWIPRGVESVVIRLPGSPHRRIPLVKVYEQLVLGRLGALPSSFGLVEIAVREGNAARRTHLEVDDSLSIHWERHELPHGSNDGKYRAS